jgi:TetR/AcrR family transcriptional regulator, regulator of cefoperazone and chloramphenicol sensitivity
MQQLHFPLYAFHSRRGSSSRKTQVTRSKSSGSNAAHVAKMFEENPRKRSKRSTTSQKSDFSKLEKRLDTPVPRQNHPDTRQRVIEAAICTIVEQGFYRASSNAIAERAGLSWGVIQYHFGSRESLMLAVLEEGTTRLVDDDPRTSMQTLDTMTQITGVIDDQLDRLTKKLFAGMAVRRRALRGTVFHMLRGLALSEAMLSALPFDTPRQNRDIPLQRRLAAEALTLLIENEADIARSSKSGRLK